MDTDRIDFILLILYAITIGFSIYYQLWAFVGVISVFALITFVQRYAQERLVDDIVDSIEKKYSKSLRTIEIGVDDLSKKIELVRKELVRDVYLIEKSMQANIQRDVVNSSTFDNKIGDIENKITKIEGTYERTLKNVEGKIDALNRRIIILQKDLTKDVILIDKSLQDKKKKEAVDLSNFAEKIIQLENKLNRIKAFLEE